MLIDVAVKKIANMDDDEIQMLTEREVNMLRSIRHPNIVQFMGVCQHSSGFYIITEYVPRGCVRKWLKDERIEIRWKLRVKMSLDVARAMNYMHSKNIIHRDLKSKNLLVDENVRVKVCDFGLARNPDATRPMSMCGTDAWIAPEVMLGLDYNEKADVFSYGMVLAEIITRKKPNEHTLKRELPNYAVNFDELRSLTPKDCPKSFLKLTMDCLAVEPERRPDFAAVVERLKVLDEELSNAEEAAPTPKKRPSRSGPSKARGAPSSSKGGGSRGRSGGRPRNKQAGASKKAADTVTPSKRWARFEVQKVNRYGLKQPRIVELNVTDGILRNLTKEGELKKQFLSTAIKQVVKHSRETTRLRIDFNVVSQRPYDVEFDSSQDRDKFCEYVAKMLRRNAEEKVFSG